MDRRQFLGALASAPLQIADTATAYGIIDTHTHFYDPQRPQGVPWPPKNDTLLYRTVMPSEFRTVTAKLGVAGTIVVEASPWVEDNQWILDLARDNAVIVGLIGNLPAGTPAFRKHLYRFVRNPLFLGIRLGGKAVMEQGAKPELIADLKLLGSARLTLDVLGGVNMLPALVRLTDAVPSLTIVINHLPFEPLEDAGQEQQYDLMLTELGRREKVFAKISNVPRRVNGKLVTGLESYRPRLDKLWEAFGPDRLVFGSNWPVSDRVAPYVEVYRMVSSYFSEKGADAAEKYFRRNSLEAYRWIRERA